MCVCLTLPCHDIHVEFNPRINCYFTGMKGKEIPSVGNAHGAKLPATIEQKPKIEHVPPRIRCCECAVAHTEGTFSMRIGNKWHEFSSARTVFGKMKMKQKNTPKRIAQERINESRTEGELESTRMRTYVMWNNNNSRHCIIMCSSVPTRLGRMQHVYNSKLVTEYFFHFVRMRFRINSRRLS